jgi:UDP-N-acetylglucosamine--N-acetylmuramyl-(pentapeptide) pyrophosphoryl-undecaprenol N-acetylglucosamine transferase
MRIVVSGGGTAGHISPTLATSDALKSLDKSVELLYIGQADGMEAKIVSASGLKFASIKAGKFRRYHSANAISKVLNLQTLGPNARDAVRAVSGLAASIKILRNFRPNVVFIKGGYVGLPVGLAARLLRIPYVIHESDVSPGLANRTLGRWATKIAVGFPVKSYHDFDPGRLVFTGSPVRAEVLGTHRLEGLAKFGLDEKLPVVLVTGGSAGAMQVNNAVLDGLGELLEVCQVIHLTGEHEYERVKFEVRRRGKVEHIDRYHLFGFLLTEMAFALAAADLVISRAGANTIAELAALGKPTVLIPNYEMAGHQVENARVLSRAGAARVLDGERLTAQQLVGEVKRLIGDPEEQGRLSKAIRSFSRVDAAVELARVILEAGRAGERAKP